MNFLKIFMDNKPLYIDHIMFREDISKGAIPGYVSTLELEDEQIIPGPGVHSIEKGIYKFNILEIKKPMTPLKMSLYSNNILIVRKNLPNVCYGLLPKDTLEIVHTMKNDLKVGEHFHNPDNECLTVVERLESKLIIENESGIRANINFGN